MLEVEDLNAELAALADSERAQILERFFKTGKGEYGEGDRFLGVRVPEQRKIARRYRHLSLKGISRLLHSPIHEHRFTGVAILVMQYQTAPEPVRERIFQFYLRNARRLNSWDLVDVSAAHIAGRHLVNRSRGVLYELAKSPSLWERRIAILATFAFLRSGDIQDTFRIAGLLLSDRHDLIHKAVGWALREAGRASRPELLSFLRENYAFIPRTTLRYAIEHLPDAQRKLILNDVFD